MSTNYVEINMLGNFIVSDGKADVTSDDLSNQLAVLLSYLVMHKDRNVEPEEISDILWPEGIANSSGALKNLVYRLRKVFEDKNFKYARDIVISNQGSYKLNPKINFEIDTESFSICCKRAMAAQEPQKKETLLIKTLKYYHGDFMPLLTHQPWAEIYSKKFHDMYFEATYALLDIFREKENYDDMLTLAKRAIYIDRYQETAHRYIMLAYYKKDFINQALTYYKHTRELFYRELGVELSEVTRDFYSEISKSSKSTNVDIMSLKEEFMERSDQAKDTFYCELEVFKQLYRFNARVLGRTGLSFFMGLMTVNGADDETPDTRIREKAMSHLYSSIQSSLRRGDVFSRCSPNQYVIMLPSINFENGIEIMERITRKFKTNYHSRKIVISHNIQPIEPSDF